MKLESKRIFIPNLPEVLDEKDVRERFFKFGNITSIEIKTRKELGLRNHSHLFAFVNIKTDPQSLKQCFDEFTNKKWGGSYVEVQLAKESFLERLKKERQEAEIKKTCTQSTPEKTTLQKNGLDLHKKRTVIYSSEREVVSPKKKAKIIASNSSSSEDEDDTRKITTVEPGPDYSEIVVKNNKFKKAVTKIEGCGKAPIIIQQKQQVKKKSKDPYREQADQKRIYSMHEMKKGYMQQKSTIQAALSNIDGTKTNKIVFNDDDANPVKTTLDQSQSQNKQIGKAKNQALFTTEDDDTANDIDTNFSMKEQFEGKKGKKLFELQTRFNQDERFKMDKRFAEDHSDDSEADDNHNEDDVDVQQEKRQQLEILGEVLGKKIEPKTVNPKTRKTMLRFDPNEPEHSKYEITDKPDSETAKKKKTKSKEPVEEKLPEVSQATFYQVSDTLKEVQEEQGEAFSLLKAFGSSNEHAQAEVADTVYEEIVVDTSKSKKRIKDGTTPFKFDSSDEDDDDDTESSRNLNKPNEKKVEEVAEKSQSVALGTGRLWTESFFFKADDYRFQEGLDFIKRMGAHEEDGDYATTRRKLKGIVKKKVSTQLRKKQKMFGKKIGKFGKKFKSVSRG